MIDRSLTEQPTYQSRSPKYCLLVFGPTAGTRLWLVLDGNIMHVQEASADNGPRTWRRVQQQPVSAVHIYDYGEHDGDRDLHSAAELYADDGGGWGGHDFANAYGNFVSFGNFDYADGDSVDWRDVYVVERSLRRQHESGVHICGECEHHGDGNVCGEHQPHADDGGGGPGDDHADADGDFVCKRDVDHVDGGAYRERDVHFVVRQPVQHATSAMHV